MIWAEDEDSPKHGGLAGRRADAKPSLKPCQQLPESIVTAVGAIRVYS